MKFYRLEPAIAYKDGVTTTPVRANQEMMEKYKLNESITRNQIWTDSPKIKLIIYDERGLKVRFSDIHHWHSNQPLASHLVLNDTFKKLLKNFRISEHIFYPAEIKYRIWNKDYWVLHLINNSLTELNFSKSQFEYYDVIERQAFQELETGEIENIDRFNYLIQENKKSEKISIIRLKRAHYEFNYDIFSTTSSYTGILISNTVKEAIESSELDGYEIKEFSDYEITVSSK